MRQQFLDQVIHVRRQPREDVFQVRIRVMAIVTLPLESLSHNRGHELACLG